jgi:hypothetical protein
MQTSKDVRQAMKFTRQELPTAPGVPPGRTFDADAILSKRTRGSSVWVIDFFETGDGLTEGFEDGGKEFEINRRASKVAVDRLPGVKRVGRLEESVYWLFSAAMLGYLLLEIIGR